MSAVRSELLGSQRLTAEDALGWEFSRSRWGGLDPDEVRRFQRRAAEEIAVLAQERANAHEFPAADAAAREATHILVHARRTGENTIREAQAHARRVTAEARANWDRIVGDGRARHDELVTGAQEKADSIIAEAAVRFPADAQAQAAYLDTFAGLMISQLRHAADELERRLPPRPASQQEPL